jgi:hypothetical protein
MRKLKTRAPYSCHPVGKTLIWDSDQTWIALSTVKIWFSQQAPASAPWWRGPPDTFKSLVQQVFPALFWTLKVLDKQSRQDLWCLWSPEHWETDIKMKIRTHIPWEGGKDKCEGGVQGGRHQRGWSSLVFNGHSGRLVERTNGSKGLERFWSLHSVEAVQEKVLPSQAWRS